MAKKNKHKSQEKSLDDLKKESFKLSESQQDFFFIAIIAALLIYLLKPLVIDGLSPQGVDVLASIASNHQVSEWQKESGEQALWNPNVFAGMPRYQRLNPVTYSVDTLLNGLGGILNNVFIYYLFAGIGMYLLLRFLKMKPLVALAGALFFILMPHFKSLYLEGHYTKFRALMLLPWVTVAFLYFLEKRSLVGAAFFALAFGIQIRTQHYQIVFYTGLLIFAVGIGPMLKDLSEKKYAVFTKSTILIIAAVFLAIMTAAQPLFLAKEYLPWSKRGKTTIDIQKPEANQNVGKTDGVTMEYATQWSTAPSEMFTWIIPHFYGGMSGEKYTGDAVKQLKGRVIPGYWGEMPFTQSYEYMGAITFLLAFIGLVFNRKNKLVISLSLFAGFLVLLSFGRHASWFYSLFYDYVPFFNKFRAPMMSVTVTFFIVALLAGFGLMSLMKMLQEKFEFKDHKQLFIVIGSFIGLGVLVWIIGQGFSFAKIGEGYDAQTIAVLKTIRKEMFDGDMLRYLALIAMSGVAIIVYLMKKIPFSALAFLLTVIAVIDLVNIQNRVSKDYIDVKKLEARYFQETSADRYILQDKELFRVFPVGRMFGDNRFGYFHQNLGGYTPIKMFTVEEIVENNLGNGAYPNRNVMQFMNVKYLISQQQLNQPDLQLVQSDPQQQLFTYLYKNHLDRGFFVGAYKKIEDEFERVREINNPSFKPDSVAILETDLDKDIAMPDSSFSKVAEFNPNLVRFETFTDKQTLFVISENFYPPGWHVSLDGEAVDQVYKTNHAIQSIVLPQGNHIVELKFAPESYSRNVLYATGSLTLVYLILLSGFVKVFLDKKNKLQA